MDSKDRPVAEFWSDEDAEEFIRSKFPPMDPAPVTEADVSAYLADKFPKVTNA